MTETILLRMPQVEAATGLKKSSLYQRMKDGTFPEPVRLGPKSVAWKADLVENWINDRPQAWQKNN